jgi:uncharacterized protein (UPF0332 family)
VKAFAASEWQRAQRTIQTAAMLTRSDPDSAVSRAYYAAFHAVTAVFAWRGQGFSKHSALRAALHRDLINTGQWLAELGKDYDFLMDLRETGDYGGLARVTEQDAEKALEAAQRILAACQKIQPELAAP